MSTVRSLNTQNDDLLLRRLRLQICRSLGFEPVIDKNGNVIKILVREYPPLRLYHVTHTT